MFHSNPHFSPGIKETKQKSPRSFEGWQSLWKWRFDSENRDIAANLATEWSNYLLIGGCAVSRTITLANSPAGNFNRYNWSHRTGRNVDCLLSMRFSVESRGAEGYPPNYPIRRYISNYKVRDFDSPSKEVPELENIRPTWHFRDSDQREINFERSVRLYGEKILRLLFRADDILHRQTNKRQRGGNFE